MKNIWKKLWGQSHPTACKYLLILFIIILFVFALIKIKSFGSYFVKGPKMIDGRAYHKSFFIDNNKLLITGGVEGPKSEKNGINSAEIYYIKENVFKTTSNMNLPHLYHEMFKLSNGNILIADINGIEIYDIKKQKFSLLNIKPQKRYPEFNNFKFMLLPNDLLLVIGGRVDSGKTKCPANLYDINLGEVIDLKNDKLLKTFYIKGSGFGITQLKNGNVLILGGKISDKIGEDLSDNIYIFDAKKMKVDFWGKLKFSIFNPFVFSTSKDKVIVIGGELFEKKEYFCKSYFVFTKGSPFIQIIDMNKKTIEIKDISPILLKNNTFKNFILDVIQLNDDLYWLKLRTLKKNNSVLLDINTMKEKHLNFPFLNSPSVFWSNNIRLSSNRLIVTGGKLSFQTRTESSISSEQIPYAKDRFTAESEKFIQPYSWLLKIK